MRKKLYTMIMLASLLVGVFGTSAFAADYVDKPFSFYVSTTYRDTSAYTKYTDSSVYIHVTEGSTSYVKVQALGYYSGQWINRTVGTTANVPVSADGSSGKSRIRAALLENNNGQPLTVKLRFPVNSQPTVVGGVWSPDCLGSYPAVN